MEKVSRMAVLETTSLKLVRTAFPSSSFPSQSPASDCSFAKAAVTAVGLEAWPTKAVKIAEASDASRKTRVCVASLICASVPGQYYTSRSLSTCSDVINHTPSGTGTLFTATQPGACSQIHTHVTEPSLEGILASSLTSQTELSRRPCSDESLLETAFV